MTGHPCPAPPDPPLVKEMCANCRYWNAQSPPAREYPDMYNREQCRRHAPTISPHEPLWESRGVWPMTSGMDGCGDFEPYKKETE